MIPCTSKNKPRIRSIAGLWIAFPGEGPRRICKPLLARAILFCLEQNAKHSQDCAE